jgi:hypothetical protein
MTALATMVGILPIASAAPRRPRAPLGIAVPAACSSRPS